MGSQELIRQIANKLTFFRRINAFAIALSPLLFVVFTAIVVWRDLLPFGSQLTLRIAAFGVFIFFGRWTWKFIRPLKNEDAAALLDKKLGGKDRFLTVSSLETTNQFSVPALAVVAKQADALAANYRAGEELEFRLEKPTKLSLCFLPIATLLLTGLFLYQPAVTPALARALELGKEQAEEIRELVANTENLPEIVKNDLLNLAETLEETGLYSEEALEKLEQATADIGELQKDFEAKENTNLATSSETKKLNTQDEKPESASESSKREELQQKNESQIEESSKQENEPKTGAQRSSANTEKQVEEQSEKKSEQGSKEGSGKGEKQDQGQTQSSSGEKKEGEGNKEQQGKDASKNGSGQGEKEKDEKKDVTGLGEGSGDGKSGDNKEQGGEPKPGQNSEGAKSGEAKNKDESGDQSESAESSSKKQEGQKAGEKGNKAGSKQQGAEGKEQSSGDGLKDAENKLQEIKKEMQKKDSATGEGQSKKQEGAEEQTGKKQGSGKEEKVGDNQQNQAAKDAAQKGEKSSAGQGEKDKQGENTKPDSNQNKGKGNKQDQGAKSESQAMTSNNTPEQERPAEGSGKNNPSQQEAKSDKQGRDNSQGNPELSAKGKSDKPLKRPEPSDTATRFGPFSGGNEGNLRTEEQKTESVTIPQEEKIIIRGLGQSDGKRYKNPNQAQAKTELGESDFEKPKSEFMESSQPMPIEYKDLLKQ